jgi:hypothetical protein
MNLPNADKAGNKNEAKLPRRDRILLPMLSFLTICFLAGSVELIARQMFTQFGTPGEDCMVLNDPATGPRGIPHSVCRGKVPEGELTEYRFNSSGYRDDVNFGPKSPGTYRIVMVGTSVALGMRVPQERIFATLLPDELSHRTGRKVELYNESMPRRSPHIIALDFKDVLSARPDMILWILTPPDIEGTAWAVSRTNDAKSLGVWAKTWHRIRTTFAHESFASLYSKAFNHPRTAILLRDILYASPSLYVKSSFIRTNYRKAFLKSEPSPKWQMRLEEFDSNAADIEGQAREAGIPIVAVLVPDRTQAAMISMGDWPRGFNPYKLDGDLRSIIVSHGGIYIDILPDFRTIPNPQLGYFAVDVHPNADGHRIISGLLAKALTSGAVPALRAAPQPQSLLDKGR